MNGSTIKGWWRTGIIISVLLTLSAVQAQAAAYTTNTFDAAAQGWFDPGGQLSVSWTGSQGNPAGSIEGTFAASFIPQTDNFQNTQPAFTGNYNTLANGFGGWSFDFYAADVAPGALVFTFSDGTFTFSNILTPQITGSGSWFNMFVSSTYSAGWVGSGALNFATALNNVSYVAIQVTQSGIGSETYRVDNVAILEAGGGPMAVPEPSTFALAGMAGVALLAVRRKRTRPACTA